MTSAVAMIAMKMPRLRLEPLVSRVIASVFSEAAAGMTCDSVSIVVDLKWSEMTM